MHILEHHMLEWIGQHHMGCGLLGEQGAELVHSQFNSLVSTYKTIPDPVERLRCVMKEHFLKVSPQMQRLTPPNPKRNKVAS